MRGTAVIVGLWAALTCSSAARAGDDGPFGAIAYSQVHDNVYAITGYDSQAEAEATALKQCREANKKDPETCSVPLWFRNACGALSKAGDGSYGTGWGTSQELAADWANKTCAQYGGTDCKLQIVACSPGGAGYIPAN